MVKSSRVKNIVVDTDAVDIVVVESDVVENMFQLHHLICITLKKTSRRSQVYPMCLY
jgi:hypothetical protein